MSKLLGAFRRIPPSLIPFMILEAALKAVAGWRAVRNRQYLWLLAIIVVNSAGVLPVAYLKWFQKRPERAL